jgi:hypothetical protein
MSQPDGLISQASWPKGLMEIYVPFGDVTDARNPVSVLGRRSNRPRRAKPDEFAACIVGGGMADQLRQLHSERHPDWINEF